MTTRMEAYSIIGFAAALLYGGPLIKGCSDKSDLDKNKQQLTQSKIYDSVKSCLAADNPEQKCLAAWQSATETAKNKSPIFSEEEKCRANYGAEKCHASSTGRLTVEPSGFQVSTDWKVAEPVYARTDKPGTFTYRDKTPVPTF